MAEASQGAELATTSSGLGAELSYDDLGGGRLPTVMQPAGG